jgi:hypothetical protein
MYTIHGDIRLTECNDYLLDYRMDDLHGCGVGAVDALHRLRILARNIIVGDLDRSIDHVAARGVLVALDIDDLSTGPEERAVAMAHRVKSSVMVQVGSASLEWEVV